MGNCWLTTARNTALEYSWITLSWINGGVTIVGSHWVGTDQLFKQWYFRNVLPTHDRMRQSCAAPLPLCENTSLITCSNVAMKLRLRDMRWAPIVSRHKIMWQTRNSFMHSEHSCDLHRRVWRVLANLVIGGFATMIFQIPDWGSWNSPSSNARFVSYRWF